MESERCKQGGDDIVGDNNIVISWLLGWWYQ